MVDSNDIEALRTSITKYWSERTDTLDRMRTEGPAQAAKFSWTKSAQTVLDVAEEISK
jgi:hypothetical protein